MSRSRGFDGEKCLYPITITVLPDANLITQLAAWRTAKTVIEGQKFCKFSTSANNTVSLLTAGDVPELRIEAVNDDNTYTYTLTVTVLGYKDAGGAWKSISGGVFGFTYTGSPSRGNQIIANATDQYVMKGTTSGGAGKIISIDSTNSIVYAAV